MPDVSAAPATPVTDRLRATGNFNPAWIEMAELDPSWLGHSIGRFETKDTLVIDTVGYNDKFWFDRRGHPHTEQLHTIERWTRLNLGELENKFTLDDPGAYSKSIDFRFVATLMPPQDELLEYICQENNQYGAATIPGYKGRRWVRIRSSNVGRRTVSRPCKANPPATAGGFFLPP